MGSLSAEVGIFEDARYPEGESVAQRAYWHEYGRGVPERPFFRPTIAEKQQEWSDLATKGAQKVLEAEITPEQFFETLGALAAGNVKETISALRDPPLHEKTIERKGFDKPLVDTGVMLNSISHRVEVPEGKLIRSFKRKAKSKYRSVVRSVGKFFK